MLCAYLRMPYEPDPGDEAPEPDRLSFRASREVRHTVIRIITAHLKDGAAVPWQGLNFDFWSVVFDGGDFRGAKFLDGTVDFHGAEFSSGTVYFDEAEFSGGTVSFDEAEFSGGTVSFRYAEFSGAMVTFIGTRFSGATVNFYRGEFSGGMIYFNGAEFSGGTVDFPFARFSGTEISLAGGMSMDPGAGREILSATFSGGEVNFMGVSDWSYPPRFPRMDKPPRGVKLPREEGQSQA